MIATHYPTTSIDLRSATNFEQDEAIRIPLNSILVSGSSGSQSAHSYMESIGSSRPFKIDSNVVADSRGTENLEWWLRIYRSPEENGILPGRQAPYSFVDAEQEIDDEFDCEAERGL
jgi:hypothetical protein